MLAGPNVLNSELLGGRGAIQSLSDLLGSGPLGGRGAIQTLSGEAMGLRGLCFLGMLTTTQTKSTHPHVCASQLILDALPGNRGCRNFPAFGKPNEAGNREIWTTEQHNLAWVTAGRAMVLKPGPGR